MSACSRYSRGQGRRRAAFWASFDEKEQRRRRIVLRPGYGMGMGAHTLIHNGRKP